MATIEKLNGTLQENVLTLLAHSDVYGKVVRGMVEPQLFEGEYRTIAERCADYWDSYGKAPGDHMVDLVDDILSDPKNRKARQYRRILQNMLELSDGINVKYVIDKLSLFSRMQRFKDIILRSAEQLNAEGEVAVAEVEKMWGDMLRERRVTAEPATRLSDYKKLLKFMETQWSEFSLGIAPFDERELVPSRGSVLLFLAAAKRGKSWFLLHAAIVNMMRRHKVIYFSLEMSEEEVLMRAYQRIFQLTKTEREIVVRKLVRDDETGKLVGLSTETEQALFTLRGNSAEDNLRMNLERLGKRADNLRVKRFPTRRATVADLEAYLDYLEVAEGFIPDLIVLDYAGILHEDVKNARISRGRNLEDFRALCISRNAAGLTAGQLSKEGAEAMQAGAKHVAEDWSMIGTSDITMVFSSSDAEKELGLGRCRVTNARNAEDNFGVLLTQHYASGQFVLDAIRLNSKYYEMLDEAKEEAGIDEEPEEEDDE